MQKTDILLQQIAESFLLAHAPLSNLTRRWQRTRAITQ